GNVVFDTYDRLAKLAGAGKVVASGVRYPAVGLTENPADWLNAAGAFLHIKPLGAYTDSVRAGTANVQSQIESFHGSCPSTRFILSGYSQGAQAVADALQRMPQSDKDLVAAAAFFGDPYRNASSWADRGQDSGHYGALGVRGEYPEQLHGKVFSYCRKH